MTSVGLVVVEWSRWGQHRLYVKTVDEQAVGWFDRETGYRQLDLPEFALAFDAAVREATANRDTALDYAPQRVMADPDVDLIGRRAGELLADRIAALSAAGRLHPPQPDFEGRRAYSSWELGQLGEQHVAAELERLADLDPRWSFINSIPLGNRRSDIDHLVIGPGGVYSVNAKHHHGGDVWVAEDAFRVNRNWMHYIRHSRTEAGRAAGLLSTATGTEISVTGLVVLVGVAKLTVKAQPADVRVLEQSELVRYLLDRPPTLADDARGLALSRARLGSTWR